MRRFFIGDDRLGSETILLSDSESRHVTVLRLQPGDLVELYDGSGGIYTAEIIETGRQVRLRLITNRQQLKGSAGSKLLVAVGVVKAKKMEMMVEKCTELGVDGFLPLASSRSQGKLVDQIGGRRERWSRIIAESCKQCRRSKPMELYDICQFSDLLDSDGDKEMMKLIFWEQETAAVLSSYLPELASSSSVLLVFGPEGGFAGEEIVAARQKGFYPLGLGSRILRTETAVIAGVALVQQALGNI